MEQRSKKTHVKKIAKHRLEGGTHPDNVPPGGYTPPILSIGAAKNWCRFVLSSSRSRYIDQFVTYYVCVHSLSIHCVHSVHYVCCTVEIRTLPRRAVFFEMFTPSHYTIRAQKV